MKVSYPELKKNTFAQHPILSLVRHNHWFLWGIPEKKETATDASSRYFGYWIKKNDVVYKILHAFEFEEPIKKIEILSPYSARLTVAQSSVDLSLDSQGLMLKTKKPVRIKISLDMRTLYSSIEEGNVYSIAPLEHGYFVNFTQENEKFSLSAYVFFEGSLKYKNEWKTIRNEFDQRRISKPYDVSIFEAFEGYVTECKIFHPDKEQLDFFHHKSAENEIGFLQERLIALMSDGMIAGLPWFPQRWFRDELISLWITQTDHPILSSYAARTKDWYREHLEDVSFINKQHGIESIDTFPWILQTCSLEGGTAQEICRRWVNRYVSGGKLRIPKGATWMDTLDRPHALEVNALFFEMQKKYPATEKEVFDIYRRKIKTHLVTETFDAFELQTPNIFLAYLISPDLLSSVKWEVLFDRVIKINWCAWGGFSSVSLSYEKFFGMHTGEIPDSYHQGDSWFWMNNIAGIALSRINKKKYKKEISAIKKASLANLLNYGSLGFSSELTSASALSSQGSPIQLWSLATLLRLLQE